MAREEAARSDLAPRNAAVAMAVEVPLFKTRALDGLWRL